MGVPGIVEGRTAAYRESERAPHHVNRTDQMVFGTLVAGLLNRHEISNFAHAVVAKKARDENVAFGEVLCFVLTPSWAAGARRKCPPLPASSSAPNTLGESKSGRQPESIEPFLPTSATV